MLDLALADHPDRHLLVLTEEQQRELLDGIREVGAFLLALRRELPGGSGLSLLGTISLIAEERSG